MDALDAWYTSPEYQPLLTLRKQSTSDMDMLITLEGLIPLPALQHRPPSGPDWVHEIKQDGYRLISGDGTTVRLFTRNDEDQSA